MKIINFLIGCILFLSCTTHNPKMSLKDLSQIDVNANYPLDSIIKCMKILRLETSDSCLIGNIVSIQESQDYYFIVSGENETLYKFNKEGKFISKIGVKGEGPEEYVSLYQIELDETNKKIYVLDYLGQKLISYTFDGAYITSYKMPSEYSFNKIALLDNKIYYFSTNNAIIPDILSFDPITLEYTVISQSERKTPAGEAFMGDNFFYHRNSKLYFYHYFNDTIYTINNDKVMPFDLLDLGDNRFTYDEIKKFNSNKSRVQLESIVSIPNYTFIFYVVTKFHGEARKKMMSMYSEREKIFYPHVNLTSKKHISILKAAPFISNNDSTIIQIKSPSELDNNIRSKYNIGIEDNPVLFIYYIK